MQCIRGKEMEEYEWQGHHLVEKYIWLMGNIIIHWLYILQSVENIFTILSCWWENSFALWPCCWLWCWTFFLLSNCKRKRERLWWGWAKIQRRQAKDKKLRHDGTVQKVECWTFLSSNITFIRLINPLCTMCAMFLKMLECYWNHRSLYISLILYTVWCNLCTVSRILTISCIRSIRAPATHQSCSTIASLGSAKSGLGKHYLVWSHHGLQNICNFQKT